MHLEWIVVLDAVVLLHDYHGKHTSVHQVLDTVRNRVDCVIPSVCIRFGRCRFDTNPSQGNSKVTQWKGFVGRQGFRNSYLWESVLSLVQII